MMCTHILCSFFSVVDEYSFYFDAYALGFSRHLKHRFFFVKPLYSLNRYHFQVERTRMHFEMLNLQTSNQKQTTINFKRNICNDEQKKGVFHSNIFYSFDFVRNNNNDSHHHRRHSFVIPYLDVEITARRLVYYFSHIIHIYGQKWWGTKANASHCITLHCIASHIESKLKIFLHQMTEIVNKLRYKNQHMHLCLTSKEIFLFRFASHARSILTTSFLSISFISYAEYNIRFKSSHRLRVLRFLWS